MIPTDEDSFGSVRMPGGKAERKREAPKTILPAARPAVPDKPAAAAPPTAALTAGEACQRFDLESDEAKQLLGNGKMPAGEFCELLAGKKQHSDAIRLLAHVLPKAAAVRWACQCIRHVGLGDTPTAAATALLAAEAWAAKPTDEHRRAAFPAAQAAGFAHPAASAAMAAFWSGGSLAPPELPVVPPGEFLTARAAAAAILLAAVMQQPEKAAEKQRLFLDLGKSVRN